MAAKATKVQIALRINADLLMRIDGFAQARGRYRSEIIDRACEEYLDRHAQPDQQQNADQPPPADIRTLRKRFKTAKRQSESR